MSVAVVVEGMCIAGYQFHVIFVPGMENTKHILRYREISRRLSLHELCYLRYPSHALKPVLCRNQGMYKCCLAFYGTTVILGIVHYLKVGSTVRLQATVSQCYQSHAFCADVALIMFLAF
jgi:hypothetical protein